MDILQLINELQMARSLGYKRVIRADKERKNGGGTISVELSETKEGEVGDVVLTVE